MALAPRLLWLGYASYVSVGTALRSRDDLLGRRTTTRLVDTTSTIGR